LKLGLELGINFTTEMVKKIIPSLRLRR